MFHRALLLACMIAMAQAQAQHIKYYNPSDECKDEMCWQYVFPFICRFHLIALTFCPPPPDTSSPFGSLPFCLLSWLFAAR
jgi:hypothetical protein